MMVRVPNSARPVILAFAALTAGFMGYSSIRAALAIHYLGLNTRDSLYLETALEENSMWEIIDAGAFRRVSR
jgi:hypothetical protein